MATKNFYTKVLKKASWNAISTIFSRGFLLISMLFAARILGKEDFGIVGIIQSSIALFESIAAFGMGVTAAKHISEFRISYPDKVTRIVALTNIVAIVTGVFFSLLLYFSSRWIAVAYLENPILEEYLKIASMILGLTTYSSIQIGILIGFQMFKSMAVINFFVGLVTLTSVIIGALKYSVTGVFYGLLIVSITSALLNSLCVIWKLKKEKYELIFKVTKDEYRILWTFSIPAMLSGLMIAPVNWLGASLLVKQPNGLSSMGLFAAANQWFSILLFLPGVLTTTLLPILSTTSVLEDVSGMKKQVWEGIRMMIMIIAPITFIIIIFSNFIMGFYGDEFKGSSAILILISIAAGLASMQNLLGNALAVIDKMWLHTFCNVIWGGVYLLSVMYFLSNGYGATSLAISMIIAYFSKLLVTLMLFEYFTK